MDINYFGETRVKTYRVLPKAPNSCRLSVYANAINHILGNLDLTPEIVLERINRQRANAGKKEVSLSDPNDFVHSEDLDNFTNTYYPQITVKRIYGEKYVDSDLWQILIDNGFIFSVYHQMFYEDYYLSNDHEAFTYVDSRVLQEIINAREFDYQRFKAFWSRLIKEYDAVDTGHTELVLDVINDKGITYAVFANLNFAKSSSLIKVPFRLLKFFALLDWEEGPALDSTDKLPPEDVFNQLREKGRLNYNGFEFIYGMQEIFCLKTREAELNRLLVPPKRTFPTPLLALLLVLATPIFMFFANRGPKINTNSFDLNATPSGEMDELTRVINKNKPSTLDAALVGDDVCKIFSKESIAKIAEAKVSNAQSFSEAGAMWCEYTVEGQTPSTLTIYIGNKSVSEERASLDALRRIITTLPTIKSEHFVTQDDDGYLRAIYLVINKNKFIRLDRSSSGMITDQVLIDLANNIRGFQ